MDRRRRRVEFWALTGAVLLFWLALAPPRPIDLAPTYLADRVWLAGEPGAVYHGEIWLDAETGEPAWREEALRQFGSLIETSYVYHPGYLLLNLPAIALLPFSGFVLLHLALNALALVFLVTESLRRAGRASWRWRFGATLVAALLQPTLEAAELGQNTLLGAALFLLALRSFDAARTGLALALAVLALLVKPWLLLLLAVLPFQGRAGLRRAAAVAAAWVVLGLALPRLVLPAEMLADQRAVMSRLPGVSILAFNNVSVRALVHRLHRDDWPALWTRWTPLETPPAVLAWELIALATLGLAAIWGLIRGRGSGALLPAGMVLALLPLGVLWNHYLVMGIPALLAAGDPQRPRLCALAGATTLALLAPVERLALHPALAGRPLLLVLSYAPPALLLLTALALLGHPRTRPSGRADPDR